MVKRWQPGRAGRWWWRMGLGLPMALGLVLALIALIVWLTGRGPPEVPELVKVGRIEEFQVGEPVHFAERGFWVVRLDQDKFVALADLDPHERFREQGCRVTWRADFAFMARNGWFRGDCSGSNFDLEGRLVSGPGPRDMDRYQVLFRQDGVWVDTTRLFCRPVLGADLEYPTDCVFIEPRGERQNGEPARIAWVAQTP